MDGIRTPADIGRAWVRRLHLISRRRSSDRRLHDEIAFHLDMETEQNIRAGMDPADARRAAMLAFGGVDRVTEEVRETRNVSWAEHLANDVRHAARALRRSPGFTASAIAALSLGIGANTAVFSVVHAVVIAELPYAEPERLVRVGEANPSQRFAQSTVSPGTLIDLRQRSHTIESIALYGSRKFLFSDGTDTWAALAAAVSPEMFDVLGTRPAIGRGFERDAGTQSSPLPDILIGYDLWQRQFGGDPNVVGRTVRMDYRWPYRIVGVMPRGFSFPFRTEVWSSLSYGPTVSPEERQFRYYGAVARLRPGISHRDAQRDAASIARQLETEFPSSNAGWTIELEPLDRSIVGDTRPTLLVLLALAGCVLLIACANVATLAVARAAARRHETAVRLALGAGTSQLVRHWIVEAAMVAALGGAGGALIGYWTNRLLLAVAPSTIPRLDEVTFGGAALAFIGLATVAVAIVVGLAPALRARDTHALDAMRARTASAASGGARSRQWLLGAQVSLTFVLMVAALLLVRSFQRLNATELGFHRHDLVAAELRVPGGRFSGNGTQQWYERALYFDRLIDEVGHVPGVRLVAGTSRVPLTGEAGSGSMWRTDAPGAHGRTPPTSAADQWKAVIQLITPQYFAALGVPVVRGRAFDARDRFSRDQLSNLDGDRPPGVAIINETMAHRYWPNADPLGSRIFIFDDKAFAAYRTVIGIVADVRANAVDSAAAPTVFLPHAQNPGQGLSLVLRSDLPPSQLVGPVRNRLRSVDPNLSITSVRPFDDVFGSSIARPRFAMLLSGSFAVLALIIAGVGVFGIVGFLVARRTQELGIRIALGARPEQVLRLVLTEGLRPVVIGVVVGAAGGVMVSLAMRALLYGIEPLDAVSFVAAASLLGAASLVAAVLPASRAVRVDPVQSLRRE